jgi:hypothetical protein
MSTFQLLPFPMLHCLEVFVNPFIVDQTVELVWRGVRVHQFLKVTSSATIL